MVISVGHFGVTLLFFVLFFLAEKLSTIFVLSGNRHIILDVFARKMRIEGLERAVACCTLSFGAPAAFEITRVLAIGLPKLHEQRVTSA